MANKKTNKTKPTPATKKDSKPVVKTEVKKEVVKKPTKDNKQSKSEAKAPVVKKKRTALKATLITLAAVLGAGALGVGGYYLWNNFEVSPAQPAVDKEIQAVIYMMNALNTNSTKADFDAADKAYKALTVKQQERLKKQEAYEWYLYQNNLYNFDAKNVNNLKRIAEELDSETCTTEQITEVDRLVKSVKDINRGTDFVEDIKNANQKIAEARKGYDADNTKIIDFERAAYSLDKKTDTDQQIKDADGKREIAEKIKRVDEDFANRIKAANDALKAASDAYKKDAAIVKEFKDAAEKLDKDKCTSALLAPVETLENEAKDISRSDLAANLTIAREKLNAARGAFNTDKATIQELVNATNAFNTQTCTKSGIEAFKAEIKKVSDAIQREEPDFQKAIANANAKAAQADKEYQEDSTKVTEFTTAVNGLSPTCTNQELENVEKSVSGVDEIKGRRVGDTLVTDIETAEASLVNARTKYNDYAGQVEAVVKTISELGTTCTKTEINEAKTSLDEIKAKTRGTDFNTEFESAEAALKVANEKYAEDEKHVNDYTTAAEKLNDPNNCTSADISAANDLKEQYIDKINRGDDFKDQIGPANAKLDAANQSYEGDAAKIDAFKIKMDSFDPQTCTQDEINAFGAEITKINTDVTRTDTTFDSIKAQAQAKLKDANDAYAADATKVTSFEEAVSSLEAVKETCNNAAIVGVEEKAKTVENINRQDLKNRINTANETLEDIRDLYTDAEDAVEAYENYVEGLDKDSCNASQITHAETLKGKTTERDGDFTDRLAAVNGTLESIKSDYAADQTTVEQYVTATNKLDGDFTKAEFDAAKTAKDKVYEIPETRRGDFAEEKINPADAKFANAELIYEADAGEAEVVTGKIDGLYNATSITQEKITEVTTRYDSLSSLAKDIADDTCTTAHGQNVSTIMSTIQTQFTEGTSSGLNERIAPLSTDVPTSDAGKFHLLSIIDQYNAIKNDTSKPFKIKAITSDNQDRIESLIEKMSDVDLETAYVSNLNGPDVVTGSETYDFSDTYGNIASVTGGEPSEGPQFAAFMTISAEEATALKTRYDEIRFYFSVGVSPSSSTTPSLHVYSSSTQIGYLDPVPERNTFYEITLHMDQATDGSPIIFKITDAVGATITVTNLYGIPKA